MTREQRLELLKQIEKDIHVCSLESTLLDDAKSCAIHSAIKELEQEPVIDKIKAEIANYKLSEDELSEMDEDSVKWGMKIAYDIIEKHER